MNLVLGLCMALVALLAAALAKQDADQRSPGAITLRSATETDILAQRNRSSGFSVGVQLGLSGGVTPSASLSLGRGSASGTDVTNVETLVSAGRDLTITTPGALTLRGAHITVILR